MALFRLNRRVDRSGRAGSTESACKQTASLYGQQTRGRSGLGGVDLLALDCERAGVGAAQRTNAGRLYRLC